ncbi:MAG: YqgE/AlgH family protein [Rhodothermales bacterium]
MSDTSFQPGPGMLLIAPPMMDDPNFRRAVVLLCEHGEDGSFGLVLNRLLELELRDVLDEAELAMDTLSLGGPVQPNTLHVLHRQAELPEAVTVTEGVYWSGDFEQILDQVRLGQAPDGQFRFFLGYAGWGVGQLDEEMAQSSWIVTPVRPDEIFEVEPEKLWRHVLRRMGGEYAILANFPTDPRMN